VGTVPVTGVRSDGVWRAARANLSGGIPEIVEQVLRDKQDENTIQIAALQTGTDWNMLWGRVARLGSGSSD
jgi:hypothetical protein